jgi:hypothetical protein
MKKQIFYLASAALVAGLAACSSDELDGTSSLNLKSGELAASFETVTTTRVNVNDKNQVVWDRNGKEAIGVYGEKLNSYFKYDLKNGTDDQTKAVFSAANKNAITSDFKPTLAFYPFSANPQKDVSGGNMIFKMANEIDYVDGAIAMPMVGKIENSTISFNNTAALLKVTVVNMPADKNYAKLVSDTDPLSGSGTIDLNSTPYTLKLASSGSKYIRYNAGEDTSDATTDTNSNKAFKEGKTYDFYFVLPAGTYDGTLTFTLGAYDSGDTVGTDDVTEDANKGYSQPLSIKRNDMYSATLRYTDEGEIESGEVATLNEQLAEATGTSSYKADLSEGGTVYIPKLDLDNTLTLNLTLGTQAVEIKAVDEKTTPNVVLNITQAETEADGQGIDLTINLKKSPVTLAPAGETVTLNKVTADTYEDILTIKKGVTVSTLVLSATTNALVETGATISATDGSKVGSYIFCETLDDGNVTVTASTSTKSDKDTYELYYPKNNAQIQLSSDKTLLAKAITVTKNKTVSLDLNGNNISVASGLNAIVVDGGTLTITNTGADLTKTITGASGKAAILVQNGGTVNFSGAKISNASNTAIEVTGTGSSFTLTSGNIDGNIKVTKGGSVKTQNTATVFGGTVEVEDAASEANITAVSVGDVTVKGGTVTVNATATIDGESTTYSLGKIDVQGGSLALTNGTSTTASTVSAGTFNMNGGAIVTTSGSALSVTGGTVTIQGASKLSTTASSANALNLDSSVANITATIQGTAEVSVASSATNAISVKNNAEKTLSLTIGGTAKVTSSTSDAIVEAASGTAATINIEGGTVSTTADDSNAIALTNGTELNVTGGAITGTKSAVDITKGTLNVPSGTPAFEAKGADVILIETLTADGDAIVALEAAEATYEGANVLKFEGTNNLPSLSIAGGKFTGDVDVAGVEFFISGGSFKSCTNLRTNYMQYLEEGLKLQYSKSAGYYVVVEE